MKHLLALIFIVTTFQVTTAQSDLELISETLTDYIEGSTEGQPKRLETAFHPNLNLYSTDKEGKMTTWSGKEYILDTKEGKPTGEAGRILSVDFENHAAVAKVKISHPDYKNSYIDYFMLLKLEGKWTIIHKMYTREVSNKK